MRKCGETYDKGRVWEYHAIRPHRCGKASGHAGDCVCDLTTSGGKTCDYHFKNGY